LDSSKYHYKDFSGRNDFEEVRMTSDDENMYFYVKTVEDITSPEGTNWMNLYLNTDADYTTGWHGYDYIVNRTINGNVTSIESFGADGKYEFTYAGDASIKYKSDEMIIKVPKKFVGITGNKFTVDFKFADNVPEEDNIMLFIDKGDVAPNNRFNYRYNCDAFAKTMFDVAVVFAIAAVCIVLIISSVIVIIKIKKSA